MSLPVHKARYRGWPTLRGMQFGEAEWFGKLDSQFQPARQINSLDAPYHRPPSVPLTIAPRNRQGPMRLCESAVCQAHLLPPSAECDSFRSLHDTP